MHLISIRTKVPYCTTQRAFDVSQRNVYIPSPSPVGIVGHIALLLRPLGTDRTDRIAITRRHRGAHRHYPRRHRERRYPRIVRTLSLPVQYTALPLRYTALVSFRSVTISPRSGSIILVSCGGVFRIGSKFSALQHLRGMSFTHHAHHHINRGGREIRLVLPITMKEEGAICRGAAVLHPYDTIRAD